MKPIRRVVDVVDKVCQYLCIITLAALCLMVAYQVILRKMGYSVTWCDEIARHLFVLMILHGTVMVSRRGEHIRISALRDCLPQPIRKILDFIVYLGVQAFNVIFGYGLFYSATHAGDLRFSVVRAIKTQHFYTLCLIAIILCFIATCVYMVDLITDSGYSVPKQEEEDESV